MVAQQLYLMENSAGLFKIGISAKPQRRLSQVKNASGLDVKLLATWETEEDAYTVEQRLHKTFKDQRKHGEWFEGLSISLIESSEVLKEVKINTKTQQPKKAALEKIRCVSLNCNTTPICEKVLQSKLESSMKCVIKNKSELDTLAKEQEIIATTLLKLTFNRTKHKEWINQLFDNNTIYHANYMSYVASKLNKHSLINCVNGREFHSIVCFPWVNTAAGAKALTRVKIKEWIIDIQKAEDIFYEEIDCIKF